MKRAYTNEQIQIRKKIEVTSKMLDEMDYQDISMKTISEHISIARSSLYCYYNSKDEIMLDILKSDYLKFLSEITQAIKNKGDLARNITDIYLSHIRLLHIFSTYLTDIETHVSLDSLIKFKSSFVTPFNELEDTFHSTYPLNLKSDIRTMIDALFMLTHGLYPMIYPNASQIEAMKSINMNYCLDPDSYCYNYLKLIFAKLK